MDNLTTEERSILRSVAQSVLENMIWDKDDSIYREDYKNWIFSMDKDEYLAPKKAVEKI